MKAETKKFTILHSNDMHGDFFSEVKDGGGQLIGGLGLLSGYLNKVKQEEEHVIYVIAGDMVQGSIIDTEYKGVSTVEIMNFLSPDVVTLGNHELDHGLPHLLFLEKMANFPIVNANLYIKQYGKRLMTPYLITELGGYNILFIGIITESVLDSLAQDELIGTFVSIEDAAIEVGKICNAYKREDIDLTIALTHIGFESDIELARLLKPEWGVDLIIGGHSHTILDQPVKVNNILIAQAGMGTDQIGRFDIEVADSDNSIINWKWDLVPITDATAEPDRYLEQFINGYKTDVDKKYNAVVTRFSRKLTHPLREEESTLGNLIADALADVSETEVILIGSGSIRKQAMGPVVTLGSLQECFPFEDSLTKYQINGAQLSKIFAHIMRFENRNGEGECFQINERVKGVYSDPLAKLISLTVDDVPVNAAKKYTITLQNYHVINSEMNLGISNEELLAMGMPKVVTTSTFQVLEEWLRHHPNQKSNIEGRLVYEA
ncbi:MAG: bifunctional UDP-sugar hydrolase/5'-nucleotidase [Clostridiaceae bacterium]